MLIHRMASWGFTRVRQVAHRYLEEASGAALIVFGLTIPMVVGAMGVSVDLARSYIAQERLSHALDAAALAVASSSGLDEAELQERMERFFYKNFDTTDSITVTGLHMDMTDSYVTVTASTELGTTFMSVIGVDEVNLVNDSIVQLEVRGIEVALVLDVTGSMSTNNNIGALRTAAKTFVDIMCPGDDCENAVRIGVVPFATAVNVGPYGLGKNPSGTTYDTAFVNNINPATTFNQGSSTKWWGCVLARAYPQDTMDDETGGTWRWNMYRYVSNSGNTGSPNTNCNKAYIQPLTASKSTLKTKINGLTAGGNTLSNLGMVWGYRVLSPEFPFREGSDWEEPNIDKVALLMTDGDNNIGDDYSAYGRPRTHNYPSGHTLTDNDLNNRLALTCQHMKDKGIRVYTITFTSGIDNNTKNFFRNCATDETKYIDAPTQQDLQAAFEQIARELSNIYVSE